MNATNTLLVVGLLLGGCGGGDDAVTDNLDDAERDASPQLDATPLDGVLADKLISELTNDEVLALCEAAASDPDIAEGHGNLLGGCLDLDCGNDLTAVEDCADAAADEPFDCAVIATKLLVECDQPASEFTTCLTGLVGQFAAYADPTCENVEELPAFVDDPALIPACATLAKECPELFEK